MTYEPQEIELRARVNRIDHRQRGLKADQKTISRKQQEELQSLNQVSFDPLLTIRLGQSTIEKLRLLSINLKGKSNSLTHDDLLNHVLSKFEK